MGHPRQSRAVHRHPGERGAGQTQEARGSPAVALVRIEPGADGVIGQDDRLTRVKPGQIGTGVASENGAGQQP